MTSKMVLTMGLLYASGKIEFDEEKIFYLRCCYYTVTALVVAAALYMYKSVEAAKDMRKIFVPPPPNPMAPAATGPRTQSTYYDHEIAQAKNLIQQTVIGAMITSGIHFKMGVNQVLLLQSVMQPMNVFENKLVQKHIVGTVEERPWNETFEGEDTGEGGEVVQLNDVDKVLVKTWDDGADADFDKLMQAIEGDVDHQTESGWSALMIACGTPMRAADLIKNLLKKGACVEIQDKEGWSALHWAAYHDRPDSAKVLLQNCKGAAALRELKTVDGRTALEVAKEEGNTRVVEAIEGAATSESSSSTSSSNKLRKRNKKKGKADEEDEAEMAEGSMHDID